MGGAAGHSEERKTEPQTDAALGPEASAFSLSFLSPFSHPGNETVGLGHGDSRDSAVSGVLGCLVWAAVEWLPLPPWH